MPAQLEPVDLPEYLLYLWGWFLELSGGRGYSEAGPLPLTYQEIKAWSDLTRMDPTAWETGVLKMVDRVFLLEATKK